MNGILAGLLVLAMLVVLLQAMLRRRKAQAFPYVAAQALFTPAERSFLGVLDQAADGRWRVFGKVRIADVAAVRPIKDYRLWQRAFNRISAKHFDFVLCDKQDFKVLCAIELDDRSHQARHRQQRDEFVETLCETIRLPLLRIPARQAYSVGEIRQMLIARLAQAPEVDQHARPARTAEPCTAEQSAPPDCPECAAPMLRRTSRTGKNAGQAFWGCSRYPLCRGIVPMDRSAG